MGHVGDYIVGYYRRIKPMAHIIGLRVWGFISVKVLTTALIRAPTSFLGPNYGPLMVSLLLC